MKLQVIAWTHLEKYGQNPVKSIEIRIAIIFDRNIFLT